MGINESLGEKSVDHKVSKNRDHLRCIIKKKPSQLFLCSQLFSRFILLSYLRVQKSLNRLG